MGFFAESKLKKIPVTGGAVVTLADAPNPRGMWWADDGSIVFTPNNRVALARISSGGGPTQPLTTLAKGEITHRFPQVLPGGTGVLYTASTDLNIGYGATVMVQPLPSGTPKVVQQGAYFARYVPSGHVVYLQEDTLFAVPVRPDAVGGDRPPRADDRQRRVGRQSRQRPVGGVPGGHDGLHPGPEQVRRPPDRVDGPHRYAQPPFVHDLPSGRMPSSLRMDAASPWTCERKGRATSGSTTGIATLLTRVTSDPTNEEFPVWTPDGTRIVYRSFKSAIDPAGYTIAWKRADGTGDAQVLVHDTVPLRPGSWHPTMNVLVYDASDARQGGRHHDPAGRGR